MKFQMNFIVRDNLQFNFTLNKNTIVINVNTEWFMLHNLMGTKSP